MKKKLWTLSMKALIYGSSFITSAILIVMIGYIIYRGLPFLSFQLLLSETSYLKHTIGIFPNILNTLYLILVTMVLALPVSVGTAIYLTEYATNPKIVNLIEFSIETLAGIPSIIFGMVGMLLFTQWMGLKQGILAGSLTLVMMIIPIMIRTTQDSLKSVPDTYRQGALSLGASKWVMIKTVVIPNALSGILTGVVLSIGRITGESAALLFTAGFGLALNDFFRALTTSSASLTVALYVYASERGETGVAFAIALILLVITLMIIYLVHIANSVRKRGLEHE